MSEESGASATIEGFEFQVYVALVYLLDNIKEIDSINIESREDIDVNYSDGTTSYLQVKCAVDPRQENRTAALKDTLRVLIKDSLEYSDVRELLYVTNAYHPFAKEKEFDFSVLRRKYSYDQLAKSIKRKITTQLNNLKKEMKVNP